MTPYQKIENQGFDLLEIERTLLDIYEKFSSEGYEVYEEAVQVFAIQGKEFELSKYYFAQPAEIMDDVIINLIEFTWDKFEILN